ncbi:nucleoside diphosphate kinase, mitochondrial isoform X2 [Dromaius novaehollandiae]|uniref:nucleoside diphosphate kinase, mitochondrial isoform X2 n=1 Tax=Dromaius novaehollandiae TaxID=8790 RepID=UPI00311D9A9F
MGSLGRCLARSLLRGQPGPRRPPGPPRRHGSGTPELQEKTLVLVKPDAVQRRLVGDVIKRFERRGFKLVGMKLLQANHGILDKHYHQLRQKPFYPALLSYMTSGPLVAMERGSRQRLGGDGPQGDRLLVSQQRAGGLGVQRPGLHLRALARPPRCPAVPCPH